MNESATSPNKPENGVLEKIVAILTIVFQGIVLIDIMPFGHGIAKLILGWAVSLALGLWEYKRLPTPGENRKFFTSVIITVEIVAFLYFSCGLVVLLCEPWINAEGPIQKTTSKTFELKRTSPEQCTANVEISPQYESDSLDIAISSPTSYKIVQTLAATPISPQSSLIGIVQCEDPKEAKIRIRNPTSVPTIKIAIVAALNSTGSEDTIVANATLTYRNNNPWRMLTWFLEHYDRYNR